MDSNLEIFLLMGQSNMSGRGRLDELPALHSPQVFMFRADRWVAAEEPLHTDRPEIVGIGLGMSFAVEMVTRGTKPIGLVPCAVGGTPLSRWMPGADLYESALSNARLALPGGSLSGILWHQGESDSKDRADAESYAERLRAMITQLRADLSTTQAPFIAAELGPFVNEHGGYEYCDLVNQRLWGLERSLANYACVSSEDLTDNGDALHFNADSLRELGRRYAITFERLTRTEGKSKVPNA